MNRSPVSPNGELTPGCEVVLEIVAAAGLDGISTQRLTDRLKLKKDCVQAQASRLAKVGFIHSSGPKKSPVWIIGAKPCQMGVMLPRVSSVWDLGQAA